MCNFCTYTSKSESELETHTLKYNITHSNLDYNDHYEEVNCEIFALKQIGLFLLGMQRLGEDEEWTKWMDRNYLTPGKNTR